MKSLVKKSTLKRWKEREWRKGKSFKDEPVLKESIRESREKARYKGKEGRKERRRQEKKNFKMGRGWGNSKIKMKKASKKNKYSVEDGEKEIQKK